MTCAKAPHSARVAAAACLLDRGHGKAIQHIEAEVSVYDSLGLAEQQALLAALEMLTEQADDVIRAEPAKQITSSGNSSKLIGNGTGGK